MAMNRAEQNWPEELVIELPDGFTVNWSTEEMTNKAKFQFVEAEVSKLGPTLQRIIRSGRQPYFDLKHWDGAKAYFEANPAEDTCYIFPSGEIWGEKELAELIQSRMSQVAFAQSHGWFPVVMGRNSIALWQPTLNTEDSVS